jgi:hypothetical protein
MSGMATWQPPAAPSPGFVTWRTALHGSGRWHGSRSGRRWPPAGIARTLAAKGREQVVVDALRGEMDDNQRLVIIEGTMEGLLERSRDRRRP